MAGMNVQTRTGIHYEKRRKEEDNMSVNKKIRLMFLLLAAAALLAGCTKKETDDKTAKEPAGKTENSPVVMTAEDGSWMGKGGCYKLEVPELRENALFAYTYEGIIYSLVYESTGDKIYAGDEIIYKSSSIREIAVGGPGICIINDVTDYKNNSGNKRESVLELITHDGQKVWEQDVTEYMEEEYTIDIRFDRKGNIFILLSDNTVAVFDKEGSYLCSIPIEKMTKHLVLDKDGNMYVTTGGQSNNISSLSGSRMGDDQVWLLNTESKTAELYGEFEGYKVRDGWDKYIFILADNTGLYGVEKPDGETKPIAIWEELSLSFSNILDVQPGEEGEFLIRSMGMVVLLVPAKPSEVKPKTSITIASTTGFTNLTQIMVDFNLSNQDYVVRMIDYSNNEERNLDESINMLNMDLMAGEYPDLFDFTLLPEKYYISKDLLEDLYTYIDNDPDIKREDFALLDKLEIDEKLYYITNGYTLDTVIGLKSRFGDSYGWSLDDYIKIQSQNDGEIMYNVTKKNFLYNMVQRFAAVNVDWKEKNCSFDSEEFIKILNTTAQLRENPEPENPSELDFTPGGVRLREGTLIGCSWYIDGVSSLAEAKAETGEEITCIGWPTPDGSDGTWLDTNNRLGICSKGDKEGAWEFIKYVLTTSAKRYNSYGISINKEALEEQCTKAMTPSKEEKDKVLATEEDRKDFYDLMERSVYLGTASEEIVDIVMEEAEAFLAGDKTAEETAHIIQSRVKILISE